MKRREFIGLPGSAVAWPVAARAPQPDPPRRIGVLMTFATDDPEIWAWTSCARLPTNVNLIKPTR